MKLSKKKLKKLNILVIGDVCLDRYYFGDVERISPEGPIPILRVKRVENRLGMAANVALNCAGLGCNVTLMTSLGQDKDSQVLTDLCQNRMNLDSNDFFNMTTVKNRLVSQNQILYRYDQEEIQHHTFDQETQVLQIVIDAVKNYDAVILQDYGKGYFSDKLIGSIISVCKTNDIPVLVDPDIKKPIRTYFDATVIKPNLKELKAWKIDDIKNVLNYFCDYFIVTKGDEGMVCKPKNTGKLINSETKKQQFIDNTGAGD